MKNKVAKPQKKSKKILREIAPNIGIRCPGCGYIKLETTDSRPYKTYIRRRRECAKCGTRITTIEVFQTGSVRLPGEPRRSPLGNFNPARINKKRLLKGS